MSYWDTAPMDRDQILLFSPTLDSMIAEDHPVRLFDEVLASLDWSPWEARYHGKRGRPPIPPKVVASAILYGMSLGIRSSRRVEEACVVRLDFLWLLSGRRLDHSTVCEFRKAFGEELKDVFRQVGRIAMSAGLLRLNQIGLDGTRVRANSSRHGTATAKTLQERLAALEEQIEEAFAAAALADQQEEDLFGPTAPTKLPRELADLKRRQARLADAVKKARAADARRGLAPKTPTNEDGAAAASADGEGAETKAPGKKPRAAKVPVADPESAVMPNKDGGHAPNYTPVAAVDSRGGYIVDADVDDRPTEGQSTTAVVDRIEATFGQRPEAILADGAYADGQQLAALESQGTTAYIPVETAAGHAANNPGCRADPARPVPKDQWLRLPRSKKGKTRATLDRSAFVYDKAGDCFWCPMGRALPRKDTQRARRADGSRVKVFRYECIGCEDCPLSRACRLGTSPRRVQVDEYEPVRQRVDARMGTEEGQATYARRRWVCETPFGFLKSWMHVRQFLLRGLEKVKTEWRWACTAYNLRKLVAALGRLRAKFAALLA
jgi:transposase